MAEWNYEKNSDLNPLELKVFSNKKVWWKCEKGHEWEASIYSRVNGNGCPYCSGRRVLQGFNDLGTTHPEIAREWHPTKNGSITPTQVSAGMHKTVWWKCEKGHEWEAPIYSRVNGNGCSICANKSVLIGYNDLATTNPELAKEWHPTKNGMLTPLDVVSGCNDKVWWKCGVCGYEWETTVNHRTGGTGCPCCAGQVVIPGKNDLATIHPQVAEEWHPTKNKTLPSEYLPQSNKKVWWKCSVCGHEWTSFIYSRTCKKGTGCPKCAEQLHTSFPEQAIYYYLKQIDASVRNRESIHGMEIDVYLPSLHTAIEYDGAYYHSNPKAKTREEQKSQKLTNFGIRLIRIQESKSLTHEIQISEDILTIPYRNSEEYLNDAISYLINELFGESPSQIDVIHDRLKILESYKHGFIDNSLGVRYPELAKQWHPTKNGDLTPESFTPGSHETVWWKCAVCGNEWKAEIKSRASGVGCPVCAGRMVKIGYNDLATTHPELVNEWHPTKNGTITPHDITKGSHKKIWWICEMGHEWDATISSRIRGRGCPYCSNRRVLKGFNDLLTINPELAKEWHPTKNTISPDEIISGTRKKAWWKCKVCGHEWSAAIVSRHSGNGCPECAKRKRMQTLSRKNMSDKKQE